MPFTGAYKLIYKRKASRRLCNMEEARVEIRGKSGAAAFVLKMEMMISWL